MSHSPGVHTHRPSTHVTKFTEAAGVSDQIKSVSENIRGLIGEMRALNAALASLMHEIASVQYPPAPGAKASDAEKKAYDDACKAADARRAQLQSAVDGVNRQLDDVARRIGENEVKLMHLNTIDLPRAEKADRDRANAEMEAAKAVYDATTKAVQDVAGGADPEVMARRLDELRSRLGNPLGSPESVRSIIAQVMSAVVSTAASSANAGGSVPAGGSSAAAGSANAAATRGGTALRLTVRHQDLSVQLNENSDLKTLVRAFQLMLVVGDGGELARRANPAVAMPYTPGTGLPRIDLP